MSPTFKKNLELLISTVFLFFLLYFLSYITFIDSLCNSYSGNKEKNIGESMLKVAKCTDSFICEMKDMEIKSNKPYNWSCNKKNISIFGINYYKEKFSELLEKVGINL